MEEVRDASASRSSPAHRLVSALRWRTCSPRTVMSWCWWRGASAARCAGRRDRGQGPCRGPLVLPLDLAQPDAVERIADALNNAGLEPEIVVNNAGFGLVGAAAARPCRSQLAMIDLNVRALTELSLAFIDPSARHRGGILNVASVAAFLPGPHGGLLRHQGLRAVVQRGIAPRAWPRGVRVTALCPGPVATEFQARAGFVRDHAPRLLTRTAEQVAVMATAVSWRGGGWWCRAWPTRWWSAYCATCRAASCWHSRNGNARTDS